MDIEEEPFLHVLHAKKVLLRYPIALCHELNGMS